MANRTSTGRNTQVYSDLLKILANEGIYRRPHHRITWKNIVPIMINESLCKIEAD